MGCCASNESIPGSYPASHISGVSTAKAARPTFTPFDHPLYQGELGEASQHFYLEEYAEAAQIYRKYIEKRAEEFAEEIDGLGQVELSLGYYEWFLFRWYKEGIESKAYIGTVYDALSLCYQALRNDEQEIGKGIKWYQDMVDQYPENHAIVMGYAIILNNKGIYEEAIDYFNRVLDLKPKWVRPLECMAYIYEYKRIQKKKSCEIANKILSFDPTNRVALFVLSRNQPTPDEKIAKLKEVMALHPKYARCVNEIGIVYGGTKKEYREAI